MVNTEREQVEINRDLMLIDTARQSFDMQELILRRFMYNPATDTLVLGQKYPDDGKFISSHGEELYDSGAAGEYDDFIRGWVGIGADYPNGIIHFVPPLAIANLDTYNNAFSALEMLRDNGALPDTTVRAFIGKWEQPFSNIVIQKIERRNTLDNDKTALNSTREKGYEILARAENGYDLDPDDYRLANFASIDCLKETGIEKFNELYRRVVAGEYAPKWLRGVENMTRDQEGYIYYKDVHVEHYNRSYMPSQSAKRELIELRSRCEFLERNDIPVSCVNVVWAWGNHEKAYGQEKQAELDKALAGQGMTFSRIVVDNNWNEETKFIMLGTVDWESAKNSLEFRDFCNRNDSEKGFEVSIQTYHYGGDGVAGSAAAYDVLPSCFDYLQENGQLEKVKSQNFMVEPEREGEAEFDDEAEDDMEDSL